MDRSYQCCAMCADLDAPTVGDTSTGFEAYDHAYEIDAQRAALAGTLADWELDLLYADTPIFRSLLNR